MGLMRDVLVLIFFCRFGHPLRVVGHSSDLTRKDLVVCRDLFKGTAMGIEVLPVVRTKHANF